MALLPGARLAFLDARMEPSMLSQTLQLTPYIAIAAGILLGTAIGIICYRQLSRRVGSGISWRQAIFGARFSRLGVIIHDPDLSKPHDLDDPFFDPKVRERVGAMIANAARTK
jgi:hypothetical protein